jgi:hypothetical protein
MDKKELTETIKIIYDALNEGKDSAEEIKQLKDKLETRDFLLKFMIRVFAPIVKSSQFSFGMETTPFEMVRYMKDVIDHNVINNQSVIDDKFINEMIELMSQKNY